MAGRTVLAGRRVLGPQGLVGPARVVVEDGWIVAVEPAPGGPDVTLAPGFVDLQVNGVDDVDLNGADEPDWDRLDALLAAQGTTTWCPTLVTAPLARYGPRLATIADAARRPGPRPAIAGAHLEGPFLGRRTGAHRRHDVRPIDRGWLSALPPIVRIVTLGPEQPGAAEAIAALCRRGVLVALGHTAADRDQVLAAQRAGARLVTHLFNAMAPLDHRRPGPVGAALACDDLVVSLIADGIHLHPDVLRLAARAKGAGGYVLVTDAVAWRGGRFAGAELDASEPGAAPRLADGTLAGSALTMDRAVATMIEGAGLPPAEVLAAAATTPAQLLGLDDRGRLEPGRRADVVALDERWHPVRTWIGGVEAAAA